MPNAWGLALEAKAEYIATNRIASVALAPDQGELEAYQQAAALWYCESDDTDTDEARGIYQAFGWECWEQFTALVKVVDVEFCEHDPTPIGEHGGPSFIKLREEVEQTRTLRIYKSDGAHPLLDGEYFTHKNAPITANDVFRAVHDFYGHLATGGAFSWKGETTAYYSHAQMFSEAALPALFSETVLQQSYYAVKQEYAPQKAVIFPVTVPQPPLG